MLRINPSSGTFGLAAMFERPTGMPNLTNEGFAIAPATECVDNRKPVYWADDGEDLGILGGSVLLARRRRALPV